MIQPNNPTYPQPQPPTSKPIPKHATLNNADLQKLPPQSAQRIVAIICEFEESLMKGNVHDGGNVPKKPVPQRFSFSREELDDAFGYVVHWGIQEFQVRKYFRKPVPTPPDYSFLQLFGPTQKFQFYKISHIKFPSLKKLTLTSQKSPPNPLFTHPQQLTNLQDLDIHASDFKNLHPLLTFPLHQLSRLSLNYDQIETVEVLVKADNKGKEEGKEQGKMEGMFGRLEVLSLVGNRLQNVDDLGDMDLPKIRVIDLKCNFLRSVKFVEGNKFSTLTVLNLYKNQIQSIQPLSQCNFPLLQLLTLSTNNLTNPNPLLHLNLPSLKTLNISNNPLIELHNITYFNCRPGTCLNFLSKSDGMRCVAVLAKMPGFFVTDYQSVKPRLRSPFFDLFGDGDEGRVDVKSGMGRVWGVLGKRGLKCQIMKEMESAAY